jgi:hypothetical protein
MRIALASACALAIACGSSSSSGTYTIAFQSIAQAVQADTVHVSVFDASASPETCIDLLVKLDSHQDLPAPLVDLPPVAPCDLAHGAGSLNAPLKMVAVLAVVAKGGGVIARGCAQKSLSQDDPNVTVEVAYANVPNNEPPSTTCASLAQFCAKQCP